jgi:hypothetical protein
MSESNEEILKHCTPKQAERVRALLAKGWRIDVYDGDVHLLKDGASKIVARDKLETAD